MTIRRFGQCDNVHSFGTGNCSGAGGYWNRNRWSANSNEWVTFTQGNGYQLPDGHHQVLYKADGSQCIQVQPYRNGVFYEGDDFWEGNPDLVFTPKAVINLSKTSLAFFASESDASGPAPQTISVTNSGTAGTTLPALSASSNKTWLTVAVSGTGNTQTLTNTVTRTGAVMGENTATVTVSGSEVDDVTYAVTLTMKGTPVLTSVAVTPSAGTVGPGKTLQFEASARDQDGDPLGTQPAFVWTVGGGGTISSSGLFTAGSQTGGPYTVEATATVGDVTKTGSATVLIQNVLVKINCAGTAMSGWIADQYATTGENFTFTSTCDVSGVEEPAPAAVYTTVKHNGPTYVIPASVVPDGDYLVRLHFMDQYGPLGARKMNIAIEGETVLTNYDIVASAGGTDKADIQEFEVTVNDGNGMTIALTPGSGVDAFVSGIEILSVGGGGGEIPPVTVLSPNGGETYSVGETITISWEWDTTIIGGVAVWFSAADGSNYQILTTQGSIPAVDEGTNVGTFEWTIPESILGVPTVSTQCRIRVWEYTLNELTDESDNVFTILPAGSTARFLTTMPNYKPRISVCEHNALVITVPTQGQHEVTILDLDGSVLRRHTANGARMYRYTGGELGSGVYLVKVKTGSEVVQQKVTLMNE